MTHRALRVVMWPADKNAAEQPYNHLLAAGLRSIGLAVSEFDPRRVLSRPDIWHVHWPDAVLNDPVRPRALRNLVGLLLLSAVARVRGTTIVWTVHNLSTHDGLYPRAEAFFWRIWPRLINGYICLSQSSRTAAIQRLPRLRRRVGYIVPLGDYRGVYPDVLSRAQARERLGIGTAERVVCFVGQVRPYKGIDTLVTAFRSVPDPDARLLIAGRPNSQELSRRLESLALGDPRIVMHLRFVPDDELQVYLRAADLVALPFVQILNSASAVLALSFDRPVLVPAKGSLGELGSTVGDAWIRTYIGPLTPETLSAALEWADTVRPPSAPLDDFAWPAIARATADAYRGIIEGRSRPRS